MRKTFGRLALGATILAFGVGCGASWVEKPMSSIDESTTSLGVSSARFYLKDERVFELRLTRVEYPYVWGNRNVKGLMRPREMRIDLRDVARIEVPAS